MNVATVAIDKEVAASKYKEYVEAVKTRKSQEYNAVRRAYRALSKGYKVIDIYKAFSDTGKDANDRPKLAIVRADAKLVYLTKQNNGAARFSLYDRESWRSAKTELSSDILLPDGIFENWQAEIVGTQPNQWRRIKEQNLVTNVPIVPANVVMPHKPENYYILFEVDEWRARAVVRDPYLLQRINDNTFIVLAEWDVTDVEAIVMRGR